MACNIEACCADHAGQDSAGQGRAEQGRAGQGRAGQGRAGQGRAGQGRAGQGRTEELGLCTAMSSQTGYDIEAQGRAWHNHARFIRTKLHYCCESSWQSRN